MATKLKNPENYSPKKKCITSNDVARYAGVSQSAVSRCFKAGGSVSAKTRAKVEQAVQALNYQPNAIARGLIMRRSNIVAVIITELTNLCYPEVLSQLNRKLNQKNMRILLFTLAKESEVDQVLGQVWQYQVDGIIAAAQFTLEQINACDKRSIPLVFYNRLYTENAISSVCCDHAEGERQLVEGLLREGRKSFAVMSGPDDSAVSVTRTSGAIERLRQEPSVQITELKGDYSYELAYQLVQQLMAKGNINVDAFICANDTMAMGCLDALRYQYSIQVPEQIAVVGFDGVNAASWQSYDLTTVVQPIEYMVNATVDMLMERIENITLPAEKRIFAGTLRFGSSALCDNNL